jgi:hypothetical protein
MGIAHHIKTLMIVIAADGSEQPDRDRQHQHDTSTSEGALANGATTRTHGDVAGVEVAARSWRGVPNPFTQVSHDANLLQLSRRRAPR